MNPQSQFEVEFAVKEAMRRFEATGRLTSIDYPWEKRPRGLPITAFEATLARAASNDFEQAAKLLRVTPSRLNREIIEINAGHLDDSDSEEVVWRKRSNSPVVVNVPDDEIVVLIKPRQFEARAELARDEEGNTILVIRRVRELTARQEEMVERAEAVLRDSAKRAKEAAKEKALE